MAKKYIKEKCPHCGYETQREWYGTEIGEPIAECPKCKENIIRYDIYEYIMLDPICYLSYYFRPLMSGGLLGILLSMVTLDLISNINESIYKYGIISGCIIGALIALKQSNQKFKKEKQESLERTEDIYYLTRLYLNQLISEKVYRNYSEKCNNRIEINIEEIIQLKHVADDSDSEEIEPVYDEDFYK